MMYVCVCMRRCVYMCVYVDVHVVVHVHVDICNVNACVNVREDMRVDVCSYYAHTCIG